MVDIESTLREGIETVNKASFVKTSLELLRKLPEATRSVFATGSDNEKLLALELYGKSLSKLVSFSKEIKDERIKPSDEEWQACEEVIDAIYRNNEKLLTSFPEIASVVKAKEIQPTLAEAKEFIKQKRQETPQKPSDVNKPSNPVVTTIVVVLVICGFAFLVFVGVKVFQRQRHR